MSHPTGPVASWTPGWLGSCVAGWSPSSPGTYRFTTAGSKTLYAWVKDASGNVSTSRRASVTITTTTKQKIALDPKKIEISTTGGQVKITLDMTTQAVTIEALNSITLSAKASLKLEAGTIEINGKALTKITGKPVMIN